MKKIILILQAIMLSALVTSCYKETEQMVSVDFTAAAEDNRYTAPVTMNFTNASTGTNFYAWTFEGGYPAESKEKQPTAVKYTKAGTYTVTLDAWNDTDRGSKTFTFTVDSAVNAAFDMEVLINNFAPADVKITNKSVGGSTFNWTFEGGTPATSTEKNPANVRFASSGSHKITLEVSNGRETFSTQKVFSLDAPLAVDFDIEPSDDDLDYEVPFTANLINKTTSGLTYAWSCSGGTISSPTTQNATLNLTNAGTYTVTLTASNGKETKKVSKNVTVKANSNLYTVSDVKFGIFQAQNTIGCCFSLSNRATLVSNSINSSNGSNVNLVFFGINSTFTHCYFTSPSTAQLSGFNQIPGATATYFINNMSDVSINFTGANFDSMTNDNPLKTLNIKALSNTTSWFTSASTPRIVLFETAGGIKGAIKIKSFVADGANSYILADIKYQKVKN